MQGWPFFVSKFWQTFLLFQSNKRYNCLLYLRFCHWTARESSPEIKYETLSNKRRDSHWNLRVPSLFQGCLSRNQHWKNINIFCCVNKADRDCGVNAPIVEVHLALKLVHRAGTPLWNKLNRFRIPTGRRQTSWLYTTAAEELSQGLPLYIEKN